MKSYVTFDEALTRYIGQFGPGQWRVVGLVSLFQICNALGFLILVFLCTDPIVSKTWECIDPSDKACMAVWQMQSPSSQEFCKLPPERWRWTSTDSLVARHNLVCGNAWKVQIANSFMFVGAFVGSGFFGQLCDRIGRRRPLFLATAIVSAAAFLTTAAPSYWYVIGMRALSGLGAAGQAHCIFLLVTESTGPIYRGRASVSSLFFFTAGEFVLVALGFAIPNWRNLSIAAGAINAAVLLLYPVIPESARWLLSQGRQQEAIEILKVISAGNKSRMPTEPLVSTAPDQPDDIEEQATSPVMSPRGSIVSPRASRTFSNSGFRKSADKSDKADVDFTEVELSEASLSSVRATSAAGETCRTPKRSRESSSGAAASGGGKPAGFMQLLKTPRLLIRVCILIVTWFSSMLTYYGITLGAGGIPGSVYVTFALGTAAEVVALIVAGPSVDKIGRHSVVSLGLLLGGAANLACANVKAELAQSTLSAVGKFGCSAAESTIAIYTAELFPTSVRSSAMGIFNQASRCGSIAAPFMLMLGQQLNIKGSPVFIPYMVFGGVSTLAGLLVLLLPETLGAPMPESLEDLENLQSIFTAKPWRQGFRGIVSFIFRTRAANVTPTSAATRRKPSQTQATNALTTMLTSPRSKSTSGSGAGGAKPQVKSPEGRKPTANVNVVCTEGLEGTDAIEVVTPLSPLINRQQHVSSGGGADVALQSLSPGRQAAHRQH